MERALVRLLRAHALRASRFTLLQRRALRTSQQLRHYFVGSTSDFISRNELRNLSAAKTRPAWQEWSRGYSAGGAPNEIVVPFMGDSVPDGNLASILKKVGDSVAVDEIVAQIETDKVTIDVRSSVSGKIEQILAKEGDTVTPGTKVAIVAIGEAGAASAPKAAAPPPPAAPAAPAAAAPPPPPKPEPAKAAAASPPPPPPPKPAAPKAAPPAQAPQASQGGERRVPMTRLRKRVATRLKDSQNTFALLTTFNEIDMSNIMQMRTQHKDAFIEKHGVKLGFMSGFVKVMMFFFLLIMYKGLLIG
ncbi:hypothetical protein M758_9G164000 [Ceratodon purpureus]|nr:hypothetical protein M758_9G164000 [Ceratodon purpureus]